MKYQFLLSTKEDRIAIVTLNRPKSLNALSGPVFDELYNVFQELQDDDNIRVVILTGAGDKAFAAGGDIVHMLPQTTIEITNFIKKVRRACDRISTLSKPVIAAINGLALGGGCELAMCCDLRIASENAKFGQPEINLGIMPGAGGTQRLPRLIGMTRAKELLFTADIIDAKTAYHFGLVNRVVLKDKLMDETKAMASKLLAKSSIALSNIKSAVNSGANVDIGTALDIEERCFGLCFSSDDSKEGMKAFLEKREPVFKGR